MKSLSLICCQWGCIHIVEDIIWLPVSLLLVVMTITMKILGGIFVLGQDFLVFHQKNKKWLFFGKKFQFLKCFSFQKLNIFMENQKKILTKSFFPTIFFSILFRQTPTFWVFGPVFEGDSPLCYFCPWSACSCSAIFKGAEGFDSCLLCSPLLINAGFWMWSS